MGQAAPEQPGCDVIDIVIVNWNAGQQMLNCVNSIHAFGRDLVHKTIVVDNGSSDGSDLALAQLHYVHVVNAGENLGFGCACNLGAEQSASDYILFLNPDAAVFEGTLGKVHSFMEAAENAQVGICGVQLIDEAGRIVRSCSRFPSVLGLVSRAIGLDQLLPKLGPAMAEWDHLTTQKVDQVIGAFFFIRRSVFNSEKGFDPRFFIYFEEVDLACRCARNGWSSVYLADVQAFHSGGGSSRQVIAHRIFYSQRSRIQYAFKHFPIVGALTVLLATLCIEPISRSVAAILHRSMRGAKDTWVAYYWLVGWLMKRAKNGFANARD